MLMTSPAATEESRTLRLVSMIVSFAERRDALRLWYRVADVSSQHAALLFARAYLSSLTASVPPCKLICQA
jgi:hypothetical protein